MLRQKRKGLLAHSYAGITKLRRYLSGNKRTQNMTCYEGLKRQRGSGVFCGSCYKRQKCSRQWQAEHPLEAVEACLIGR